MKTKIIIGIVALAVAFAFAFGRYSAPEKVKTETKIVQIEKKTSKKDTESKKERHKKTVITEITRPDGTKEVTTVITDDVEADSKSHSSESDKVSKVETDKKEVTKTGSPVTISALAGLNSFSSPTPIYGASITKPVLGPITLGAFGLSSGMGGFSLGLTF